jgi:hypothetical protein
VVKGDMAIFWLSSWLNWKAPRSIAPNLYHNAIRKNISVQEALNNNTDGLDIWCLLLQITRSKNIYNYGSWYRATHGTC